MTYTARLNRKINGAARVRFISLELQEADRLAMRAAKARAYADNNPAPRALFALGA
jgi:hypothetical protein